MTRTESAPQSLAFAYDKAQTWADCMGRPFYVIEYKRGKFDAVSDTVNRKVLATISPSAKPATTPDS